MRQALVLLMVPDAEAAPDAPAKRTPEADRPLGGGIEDATPQNPGHPPSVDPPRQAVPEADDPARLEKARKLLQEAIRRSQAQGPPPTPGGLRPFPGMKVDKYFGTKLPPVCASLGCYVTDDGKFFYCINPHCHKDRKRETKYNRKRKSLVYFFCPKCKSREIQLHLRKNHYECLECAYTWKN